jgi:UDP-GlcNAc:undecaprenyl-phosphate GlcNAc-1-phosphate transferase
MDAQTLLPALAITFTVTVGAVLAIYPLAIRIGLVDHPGGRKQHAGKVPLIGGLAMFAGMVVGGFLLGPLTAGLMSALIAGFLLITVGVIDDRISLPPATRVIIQIAVILIMIYGGSRHLTDIGDPFGTGVISLGRFAGLFTVAAALIAINAYNLVDGLDGLAGSMAAIALLSIALVAGIDSVFGPAALVAVAAIAGFLVFNFPVSWNRSARLFMGDAGSTLLGFIIVWLMLGIAQGEERVISPVHCLWFAAVPIFDCLTCVARRSLKKKSPFTAGRDHFHHTLMRGGFNTRQAMLILLGFQFVCAIIGLTGHFSGVPDIVMFAGWSILGLSHRFIVRKIAKAHRLCAYSQMGSRNVADQNETTDT